MQRLDRVVKRDGRTESLMESKMLSNYTVLCSDLALDPHVIVSHVISNLPIDDSVSTCDLCHVAAMFCASRVLEHPDYGILASKISVLNLHKQTSGSFSETMERLHSNGVIADDVFEVVSTHADALDAWICDERDFKVRSFFLASCVGAS